MPPLFTISTDRLYLSWDGPPAPPDDSAPEGLLRVQPLRASSSLCVAVEGEPVTGKAPLRLAEQTSYRVFLRSRTGAPVVLRHADPLTLQGVTSLDNGAIQSGTINFEGQVGQSRFVVLVGGEEEAALELDVFPTKTSFKEVEAMREELDETLAGLAFEYLRATTVPTSLVVRPPRRTTWLTLILRVLPDLEAALRYVVTHPLRTMDRSRHFVRAEHVRRPDATLRRAVLQGRGRGGRIDPNPGSSVSPVLPTRRAFDTLDTSEHRWLRQRLETARATLAGVQQEEVRLPDSVRRRQMLQDLIYAEQRIAHLLNLDPLRVASSSEHASVPTKRLTTAPGYAEAYAALQCLSLGVSLAEGPVPHATRDLHMLYEMWCYVVVLREIARILDQPLEPVDFFRWEHRGIRMVLQKGLSHAVTFNLGARSIRVSYNPRFDARRGLLAQRPDILLEIGGSTVRRFILDSKYRRDDSSAYRRRFGAPGPPEDALGDLHRYRDAIRDQGGRRTIEQAVALYPYRPDDTFPESKLWSAIERVGVGALPLLPGAREYLTRWLARVLAS